VPCFQKYTLTYCFFGDFAYWDTILLYNIDMSFKTLAQISWEYDVTNIFWLFLITRCICRLIVKKTYTLTTLNFVTTVSKLLCINLS